MRPLKILSTIIMMLMASDVLASETSCPVSEILLKDVGYKIIVGPTTTLRVLAIGSSSTAGSGASDITRAYPHRLSELLSDRYPSIKVEVVNAGVGSENAIDASARLRDILAAHSFDLIIWQLGTNDALQSIDPGEFGEHVRSGAGAAQARGIPLFLMDSQWYKTMRDPLRYRLFVTVIGDIAAELDLLYLHRYDMMRAWDQDDPPGYDSYLSRDGFHMSDRGYDCLAREIDRSLGSMIVIR